MTRLNPARLRLWALEDRTVPALFTVNNTNDAGAGSLRQAVIDANALGGADTISFNSSVFSSAKTIYLTSGQLSITGPVDINGPTARVTLDGTLSDRLFYIDVVGSAGNAVSMDHLTLTNGLPKPSQVANGYGAAIFNNDEALTLNYVDITNCTTYGYGGALASLSPVANITCNNCTLTGNTAAFTGGAALIYSGTLTLNRCTVSANSAGQIGGAFHMYTNSVLTVSQTTLMGNRSPSGGGIYFRGNTATLRNSTFSGNSATTGGGVYGKYGSIIVQNCTIAQNSAGSGGGIYRAGSSISLASTILGNNSATTGPDLVGNVNADYSLIRSASGTITGSNNLTNVDPRLTSLADHGGPTFTHQLIDDSPCVDKGSNPAGLTEDQRGVSYPRMSGSFVDIGSVEGPTSAPWATAAMGTVVPGATDQTIAVTFDDVQGIDVSTLGIGDVTVTGPGGFSAIPTYVGVDDNTNGRPRVATYSFTPPGGSWDGLDTGDYQVVMNSNQVFDTNLTPYAVPAGVIGVTRVSMPRVFVVTNVLNSGPGSLRDAVQNANANGGADTIQFQSGLTGTIALTATGLAVSDSLFIEGPGAMALTVDGGAKLRIFDATAPFTLSGLRLANGFVRDGAAIRSTSTLVVSDATLYGNKSSEPTNSGNGGAIYHTGSSVSLINCHFESNSAAQEGGAVMSRGTGALYVNGCTFAQNGATFGGGALKAEQATNLIENSTFRQNNVGKFAFGGGVYGLGDTTVRNSTFTTNNAHSGGGLALTGGAVQNCTFSNNSAVIFVAPSGYSGSGGGIHIPNTAKLVTIESCIVYGNTAAGSGLDIYGKVSLKNSALGSAGGATITDLGGNLAYGTNPLLQPFTGKYFPLAANSPVRDKGSNPANLPYDQRGEPFARVSGAAADMGAFEIQGPARVTGVVINDNLSQRSRVTKLAVSFGSAVTLPADLATAFDLRRQGNDATVGLNATRAGNTVTLTFTTGAVEFGSLIDGRYTLKVLAAKVIDPSGQALDGNGDGTAGDDYVLASDAAPNAPTNIFRVFGDINGDGFTDNSDFLAFRAANGSTTATTNYNSAFDSDNDGDVDLLDLVAFRQRMGVEI